MSVKELFLPEDSRFDSAAGIDFDIKFKLMDVAKSLFSISAAILLTSFLSKLV